MCFIDGANKESVRQAETPSGRKKIISRFVNIGITELCPLISPISQRGTLKKDILSLVLLHSPLGGRYN